MKEKTKKEARQRKHKEIKAKLFNTEYRTRLSVFRSNKHIYAQLIDDKSGKVLFSASDLEIKSKTKKENPKEEEKVFSNKVAKAFEVGKLIAKKAIDKKIEKVYFDRASYKYHGRVKALAEGAREGGLKF